MLAQRGQEEEPAAGAQLLELVRVGVERPQQARGEGHRGGAVGEEGGVAGRGVVWWVCMDVCVGCEYMPWFCMCRFKCIFKADLFFICTHVLKNVLTYRCASSCASRTQAGRLHAVRGRSGAAHSLTLLLPQLLVVVAPSLSVGVCIRTMAYMIG